MSEQEFIEYHHFVSAFVESDKQFKTMLSGVWNMDLVETTTSVIGGVPLVPAGVSP